MTGAECRLGWEAGSRSTLSITRKLSQFGVQQSDVACELFACTQEVCLPACVLAAMLQCWLSLQALPVCVGSNCGLLSVHSNPAPHPFSPPPPPPSHYPSLPPTPLPPAIDNFDCKPAECVLDLTLRLQGSGTGRVDLLEQAILQLCETL